MLWVVAPLKRRQVKFPFADILWEFGFAVGIERVQALRKHHVDQHSYGPNVAFKVAVAAENFWRHEVRGTDERLKFFAFFDVSWKTEIYDFDLKAIWKSPNHDVFKLKVSVDNTLLMHEVNSLKQVSGDLFDLELMIQNYVLATLMQARNGILERAPPGVL